MNSYITYSVNTNHNLYGSIRIVIVTDSDKEKLKSLIGQVGTTLCKKLFRLDTSIFFN